MGRSTGKSISLGTTAISRDKIDYLKYGDHATALPQTIRYRRGGAWLNKLRYTYDAMGNISAVYEDDELICRYEYDSLNRLIREDNKAMNMSVLFAYDKNGNITSRRLYAYAPNKVTAELENEQYVTKLPYFYDGDRLLSCGGAPFVYDLVGNPTEYRSVNCVWERGRYLKKYGSIVFAYDGAGRRTNAGNRVFQYDANNRLISDGTFLYLYDHTGLLGFVDNRGESPVTYFYEKDAQGNVRAILDSTGALVVKYVYDAWGKHLVLDADGATISDATHIGRLNPFRYRSYMYDVETGLYYLQSRYYDPETGRFLNADTPEYLDPESIGGLNLYAYCLNNPVMYSDPSGHVVIISLLVGVGIAFALGAASSAISQGLQYGWDNINILQVAIDGLFAAVSVALAYTGISLLASFAIGGALGLAQYAIDSAVIRDDFTWSGAIFATITGAVGGLISGAGAQHVKSIAKELDDVGKTGVKAMLTAAEKYGFSTGYKNTWNLWGSRISASWSNAISRSFSKAAIKTFIYTPISYGGAFLFSKIPLSF